MECSLSAAGAQVGAVDHAEPGADLAGMSGGRRHGVVDALNSTVGDGKRQALQVGDATGGEGRQHERTLEGERLVAGDLEGEPEPLDQLALIGGVLSGETEDLGADL